jgi:lipoprotein-anchoring transpeptidase ErfK/SrfK
VVALRFSCTQSPKQCSTVTLSLLFALSLIVPLLIPLPNAQAAPVASDVWVEVDTEHLSLAVMEGEKSLQIFENIAIGSNGPTLSRRRNDSTTPLGEFTITEIRRSQRFKLFMAFNYPNLDHTERAYLEKRINASEYKALRYDLDRGLPPSQSTSLGGQLGIHGLGAGDLKVHETVNWTEGCIALTNEQLLELAKWVVVGTRVVVR